MRLRCEDVLLALATVGAAFYRDCANPIYRDIKAPHHVSKYKVYRIR